MGNVLSRCVHLFVVISLFLAGQALAQPSIDAGALQQKIDRDREMKRLKRIAPAKPAEPEEMTSISGVTVTVKQFRFAGNTLLTDEQLNPAVIHFLDRPLSFTQLQAVAAAVAEVYRSEGWVVRTYLPQQDIANGIVTIQIVEAVFGKLRTEGSSEHVSSEQVGEIFSFMLQQGEHLDFKAHDRALLLANDLAGVSVEASLAKGSGHQETDLILNLADEPRFEGFVTIDNSGSRSTGETELLAGLSVNSPLGVGDQLSLNAIHSEGSDYFRLDYVVPVGNDGWRIGLNASTLSYRLLTLNPDTDKGDSQAVGVELSYPIVRSTSKDLYVRLNYDHKEFDNQFLGATTTRYSTDAASVTLYGNSIDKFGGGGANTASIAWVSGQRNRESDEDVVTTDQDYEKFTYSFSRHQVLTKNLSLYAAVSGQEGDDNLDTSEKFYLGGATGVRAYPASEGAGDSGVLASVDLNWKLPAGFTATLFYDFGRVRDEVLPSYSLEGAGLALDWQTKSGFLFKSTWAHRIGNNPNPTFDGKDQDGSLVKNRFWISANYSF